MNVEAADRIRALVTVVASGILVYALYVSREHIAHVGHTVGLRPSEAETLFILVDIPIIVGKLMALAYFAPTTRRAGRKLMVAGIAVSLACNVASGWIGGGLGPAAYGVFVVGMALAMEWAITKIKPAGAITRARKGPKVETPAPRPATPRKRTPRAPKAATVAELEAAFAAESAPVSGA